MLGSMMSLSRGLPGLQCLGLWVGESLPLTWLSGCVAWHSEPVSMEFAAVHEVSHPVSA